MKSWAIFVACILLFSLSCHGTQQVRTNKAAKVFSEFGLQRLNEKNEPPSNMLSCLIWLAFNNNLIDLQAGLA
jgi:hypothetical protein